MTKYYETTKSNYSRDIDHLILFNKNGLWIRRTLNSKQRIISATKPEKNNLLDVTIYHLNDDTKLIEKVIANKADISEKQWKLQDVTIFNFEGEVVKENKKIITIYNLIITLRK